MNRLKYHSHVFVRDPVSYDHAATSVIDGLQLSHDLSFLDFKRVSDCAERRSDSDKNANTYCFIIRNYKYGSNGNACLEPMLEFADQLIAEQNAVVNWVSFQEDYDAPAINQVQEAGHSVWTWDPETMSFEDAYQIVADASCVVTARMHGTYVAGMLNVPCGSIGVHP